MLNRRSPNREKRTYVIGRRYLVEKLALGENQCSNSLNRVSQNGTATIRTDQKIGDQLGIGRNTVNRAAGFTEAVDTIVKVTGIKVNDIISGKVYLYNPIGLIYRLKVEKKDKETCKYT